MIFQKGDVTTYQDLSKAVLSYTTSSVNRRWKLSEVTIHFSVAVTETITITRISPESANYDTVLISRSLVAEQNFAYRPDGDCDFQAGEELKVYCTKANNTGVAYVTIKRRELP